MEGLNMKKSIYAIILTVVLGTALLDGCSQNNSVVKTGTEISPAAQTDAGITNSPTGAASAAQADVSVTNPPSSQTDDKDGDGIPDTVEKTYGTNPYSADTDGDGINDKDDAQPLYTDNLINETSTTALPIEIKDARVEDNATTDHLEITFVNKGTSDLSNFYIYYTITDKINTDQVEGYYQKLNGLTVKAGDAVTLHFDNNLSQAGHYYGNMNGLYGTSANGLTFAVKLHAAGYQPISFTVEKAKGTAEVAD
jgi:hypothetical protein